MNLLAIDTSTDACSAALMIDDEVRDRYELAPRKHTELILPMVESLFQEAGLKLAQIDVIAFGRGPGAFTGLRIAAGVTQGLAFGADLPVVPVSSLAALAQGTQEQGHSCILAGVDARMKEVYWGQYHFDKNGIAQLEGEEIVSAPDKIPMPSQTNCYGVGSAWACYQQQLTQRLNGTVSAWNADAYPHAHEVAILGAHGYKMGATVIAEQAVPVYLRDDVVNK